MPAFQTILAELNRLFSHDEIRKTAKKAALFAPGKPLDISLAVPRTSPMSPSLQAYIDTLPASFREMMRAVIYHALTAKKPTPITFAWAPGYDAEFTLWDAPDTTATKGGITVLVKSRYPGDVHPVGKGKAIARRKDKA